MEIEELFSNALSKTQVLQISPLALAFVGDSVHTMFVRNHLVKADYLCVGDYHKKSAHFCCANHQSKVFDSLEQILTEEERDLTRRARNAKSNNIAKNAKIEDYKKATSFEALVGYLYLIGNYDRLKEILSISVK